MPAAIRRRSWPTSASAPGRWTRRAARRRAAPPIALGRDHPDRIAITAWLTRLAADLQDSGSPAAVRLETAKLELLDSPAAAGLFASLWETIKGLLADGPSEGRAATTSRFAAELGGVIGANPGLADALDTLARRAVVSVVATYGSGIVRLVSDTIRSWDAATVTDRLEAAVGRDLQYIRINGTVIGGLIGLAIHAFERDQPDPPGRASRSAARARYGFSTTLRNSSWLFLKFLYAIGASPRSSRWVMTTRGSILPVSIRSSSGFR